MRRHPFDLRYGTRTGGSIPPWLLTDGSDAGKHANIYAGCQPSCVRRALGSIPDISKFAFIDIGCGKGRALVVASEYPFTRVIGIELSAKVARQARRNATIVARDFPGRPSIRVEVGDAAAVALWRGDVVIFLYHAFDQALFKQFLRLLVRSIRESPCDLFLIYENPVYGALVDAEPVFVRWMSEMVPCDADDRAASHVSEDAIVVWRAGTEARTAREGADKRITPLQEGQVTLSPV